MTWRGRVQIRVTKHNHAKAEARTVVNKLPCRHGTNEATQGLTYRDDGKSNTKSKVLWIPPELVLFNT